MNQTLEQIVKNFNITDQVLKDRSEVGLYIESLSSLIVDRFYDYFLLNPDFSQLINKSELPRLKRIRAQFIVSLYSDNFDEKLLEKISKAHNDSPIKVTPEIIASVFELLMETIVDISSVNHQLQRDLKTILKFLHIAEFVVQANLYQRTKLAQKRSKNDLLTALESLFEIMTIHQNRHQFLLDKWEEYRNIQPYSNKLPSNDILTDRFHDSLLNIKNIFTNMKEFNIDIQKIETCHEDYHIAVERLYAHIGEQKPIDELEKEIENIKDSSTILFEHINKPFEQTASLNFLAVNAGIRFIQKYGDILNTIKFIPFKDYKETVEFLNNLIKESLENSLSWAVSSYSVSMEKNLKKADISEEVALKSSTIYIDLNIRPLPYKAFIYDVVHIFLEILKITIINREKEHELIALADKAETANRSKDIFLANMSHELRTPLNAIIGFSQILKIRSEIPENMRPYIEKISISGNNLLNLVNTILDFAKLEAGKISYSPKITFISEIVKEVNIIVSPLAEVKEIKLQLPTDISLVLNVDIQLIKQVLINILSNAIKFTPKRGKVTLSVNFDQDRNEYVMTVSDNGVGMSQESLSKLFTPFTQIENTQQEYSKGTGLGLVISKRIIEDLHGGKIWVESELGVGTNFHISIPMVNDLTKVELFTSEKSDSQKLLIVEDSEEYINILVNSLKTSFHITVTNSINKAKELLEINSYDKVILDFFLIDGISSEVLYFMEDRSIETPVYIISAEDDFKIVEHLQESKNIVGVFNKRNASMICDVIGGSVHE